MEQSLVLNFPIRRALGLPNISLLAENVPMQPTEMFIIAINNKDYAQALRLVSSVKELQTRANLIACCADSTWAFDLLRLVPASRKIHSIIEIAASETRVARLIAEDLPDLVNEIVLDSAINGEEAWADRYKEKFKLSASQIKKLMSKKALRKSQLSSDLSL